jgi:hypothetical protein
VICGEDHDRVFKKRRVHQSLIYFADVAVRLFLKVVVKLAVEINCRLRHQHLRINFNVAFLRLWLGFQRFLLSLGASNILRTLSLGEVNYGGIIAGKVKTRYDFRLVLGIKLNLYLESGGLNLKR